LFRTQIVAVHSSVDGAEVNFGKVITVEGINDKHVPK
jgi:hypothetical protein